MNAIILPDSNSSWFAGYLDADGTITLNHTNLQLAISVSQKSPELLTHYQKFFGGNIYPDRGKYPTFKWYISSQSEVLTFLNYLKSQPFFSAKRNRAFLIPKFYELKAQKAHLQTQGSILSKAWLKFLEDWKNSSSY